MITQEKLQELVDKWAVDYSPSYRYPGCADCGRTLRFKMWHVFLKEFGNKREIHLCKKCGKKYGIL